MNQQLHKPDFLFPGAIWHPIIGHSNASRIDRKRRIVLHITDGSSARSAVNWFSNPHSRVSSHFIIDRDHFATIYQLLPLSAIGWHASAANGDSIGIEHAARPHTMPATDAQYERSAQLCAWLCRTLKIPPNRSHIRTHNEVSPRDGHKLCCTGALNPDRVVGMVQDIMYGRAPEWLAWVPKVAG